MTVPTVAERIILMILFHLVFIMFLWAYAQTIFTEISVVPKKVNGVDVFSASSD